MDAARLTSLLMDPRCVRLTDAPFLATTEKHPRGTSRWGCGSDLRPSSLCTAIFFSHSLSHSDASQKTQFIITDERQFFSLAHPTQEFRTNATFLWSDLVVAPEE